MLLNSKVAGLHSTPPGAAALPVVAIPADFRQLEKHPFHCVGDKYVQAIEQGAGALAVLLPALGEGSHFEAILELVDGILFTGSPSNVDPAEFGSEVAGEHLADKLDPRRDATTLPLIRAALERAVPILGICRGFQEINVALGGTLFQEVHAVPGYADHREDESQPLAVQYGPSHPIDVLPGGVLSAIVGAGTIMVNSLHGQGVDRLGRGLVVEARAPDGLVEAFSVSGAGAFALALQWHPEWRFAENPVSTALFRAFGAACRTRRQERLAGAGRAASLPNMLEST